ncbi:hypothetical protein [Thiohalophilus sp.]|uniref:hypothetical protein n=1 Tax=Thiohalophilus sp. TaxID=3028392 RepID=UPI002ACEF1AE|nr:hypothetical protein [Thiohalophilus sp.]MDZ7661958.1 hypothetical protein [Thiohalophilus sp.]
MLEEFLNKLLNFFSNKVSDDECLSRYIFSSKHFNTKGIKSVAFIPSPKNDETSVFRISNLNDDDVWAIGHNHVARLRKQSLKARADLLAAGPRSLSLDVTPETTLHKLHANIVNWPTERDDKIELAIDLAKMATLKSQ